MKISGRDEFQTKSQKRRVKVRDGTDLITSSFCCIYIRSVLYQEVFSGVEVGSANLQTLTF